MMESGVEDEDDAPPRKQNRIRPHPAGPSQMVLCAHDATNKNNKSKDFHTKPVTARLSRNVTNENSGDEENNQNITNAKTEPVETINNNDSGTGNLETVTKEKAKGIFVTKLLESRNIKRNVKQDVDCAVTHLKM